MAKPISSAAATTRAATVARRILRMREVRRLARERDDRAALGIVRRNLRTATAALKVFNRTRKGRPLDA